MDDLLRKTFNNVTCSRYQEKEAAAEGGIGAESAKLNW